MDGWNTYAKTEDKQKIVIYYCYCYCRKLMYNTTHCRTCIAKSDFPAKLILRLPTGNHRARTPQ